MQNSTPIFVITSQESDKHEAVIHNYSTSFEEAKSTMEKVALAHLKQALGMSVNDHMESPLYDTIRVEDISQGLTIRYRKEKTDDDVFNNDRVIDMIRIEKEYDYYVIPRKKRTVVKTFKIVEVDPVSESGSVQTPSEEEEYDSEN